MTLQKVVISEIYASSLYMNPGNGAAIYEVISLKHEGIQWEHIPIYNNTGTFFDEQSVYLTAWCDGLRRSGLVG
ncbi:hypothetical protein P4S72_27675 [Vibrio sp. PP-XX7]